MLPRLLQPYLQLSNCEFILHACEGCRTCSVPFMRTVEQLLEAGTPCSTTSSSSDWRSTRSLGAAQVRLLHSSTPATAGGAEPSREERDEGKSGAGVRAVRFMVPRSADTLPKPPFQRHPIYFPDIPLQILKTLSDQKFKQLQETGWVREVAFKTAPHVTKLEIKAFLEDVYGMQVEKIQTINYLGKRHSVYRSNRMQNYRDDDWKKAYVTFAPPQGMELPKPPAPQTPQEMLQEIRKLQPPRRSS